MIIDELTYRIRQEFHFAPTREQAQAMETFGRFMTDRDASAVMILRGSAGTGKTSLAGALVRTLALLQQKVLLLAPTGRAAKVFSVNSGHAAYTIHRKIYRQRSLGGDFALNVNLHADTLFIVDESSMIGSGAGASAEGGSFGSGDLLSDLVRFVYSGRNCRLLLIGDKAQLPPVGEEESPALSGTVMGGYGLKVYEQDLTEVLRQSHDSGILYNATVIRRMITHDAATELPKITFGAFADLQMVPGAELTDALGSSYGRVGLDETIVITRSNKRAIIYNRGIRNTILDRDEELSSGDMLMIVKNHYRSPAPTKPEAKGQDATENHRLDFIANGDRAVVRRVRHIRELYGYHFADVTLTFPDYDDAETDCTVIMDSLASEAPALTRLQSEDLYNKVMNDYTDIPLKSDRLKRMRQDVYLNALQIKYAYAITCHKAQGGQWAHVYIDQGYMTDEMLTPDYIHWLYTAFTRATDKLFLVNWPQTQTKEP